MKRTPTSTYRMQRRGGTGRTGMKTRDEDFVEHLFLASTHAYILIFTNKGRVYWLKVYEIPDVSAAGKGKHIGNLIGLQPGETVRTLLAVRKLEEENKYIFFATRNGTVKKSDLREFMHVRRTASTPSASMTGDELVGTRMTNGNHIIFLASHEGMAVRFDEEDVRPMGRTAYGVRGINLEVRRLRRRHGHHAETRRHREGHDLGTCRSPARDSAALAAREPIPPGDRHLTSRKAT
jgi:DNA gyrase subunit A